MDPYGAVTSIRAIPTGWSCLDDRIYPVTLKTCRKMAEGNPGTMDDLVCWCSAAAGRGCPIDLPSRLMPLMDELEAV